MTYLMAFAVGGIICVVGQLLIDLTNYRITPAHILVSFVTAGVVLSGIGLYQPLVDLAGAGALVPLTGLGHILAQGTIRGVEKDGLFGVFTGGLEASAAAITAAIVFSYIFAIIFKPKG